MDEQSRITLTQLPHGLAKNVDIVAFLVLTQNGETPTKQVVTSAFMLKTFKTKNGFVKPGSRVQISQAAFVLSLW